MSALRCYDRTVKTSDTSTGEQLPQRATPFRDGAASMRFDALDASIRPGFSGYALSLMAWLIAAFLFRSGLYWTEGRRQTAAPDRWTRHHSLFQASPNHLPAVVLADRKCRHAAYARWPAKSRQPDGEFGGSEPTKPTPVKSLERKVWWTCWLPLPPLSRTNPNSTWHVVDAGRQRSQPVHPKATGKWKWPPTNKRPASESCPLHLPPQAVRSAIYD
ncbi:hypothetical protein CONLIGDRAFT_640786 [Coniochaeta ligniaria NRRL 30616]|uniref:Uncharacterized protein n=1 Tax=Coniochaeta ligniaria NRRL 30616 TaxID=1408157 RepID=A0A1J7J2I8_9PEZI|nr:hypothetical protein CONLIGDRAFT_640786 [Coniochaeta ligniaria NRRL 30616]